MARERSLKTKYAETLKQIAAARTILQCQLFMDIKLPDTMTQAVSKFLEETK